MTRRLTSAAPTPRRRRVLHATLLAPVAALTLAGCQWTSTVQTDKPYEPADGRSVSLGQVRVNNMLVVADEKGGEGTLVGMVTNNSTQDTEVTVTIQDGQPIRLSVPRGQNKRFSDPQGTKTTVPQVAAEPGTLLDAAVTAGNGEAEAIRIPVVRPYPPYGDYHEGGPVTPTHPAPTEHGEGH